MADEDKMQGKVEEGGKAAKAAEVLSAEAGDAEAFLEEEEGLPPPSLRVRDKPVICM